MNGWQIIGRSALNPPPDNWRQALAIRLGHKPRRIGTWAELVLYGALCCLENAGEFTSSASTLPANALISLASPRGPMQALCDSLVEAQDGQPLPLGFLQGQANQALAHLCKALNWQGDARYLTTRHPLDALRLACQSRPKGGVLLGWVSEDEPASSQWLRLVPATAQRFAPLPATLAELMDTSLNSFTLEG
ncbi:hypothetical protein [Uliginosibacterium gangwonense]|uniref:hypothetical protein n=1 Tax=Uliginosibacterium gangwonense TaxID=392736 RepID=UPI00037636C4|nr:hypothetical protein [Uliginosibacterium gangwonense]